MPGYDSGGFFQAPAIGGALPFNASSSYGIGSSDPASIAAGYNNSYNNALGQNQANYNNILSGYRESVSAQTSAQQAIQAGYNSLYNKVIDTVSGIGRTRTNEINDASARFLADQTQGQIDRGLGNSTITTSTARGVEGDRQRQLIGNDESVSRTLGDYMSNLGLAGLHNASEGQNAITGLGLRQLDFMNSVTSKYPDAGMYAQLAQEAAHAQHPGGGGVSFGSGVFSGAGGNSGGKLGYVPSGGPYYGSGGYSPPPGTGGGDSWLMQQNQQGGSYAAAAANVPNPAWADKGEAPDLSGMDFSRLSGVMPWE